MDPKLRIVTRLPLEELWREDRVVPASRGRFLTKDDIAALLRNRLVQFIVADVGKPLQWIALQDCHPFWKNEVKPHIAGERAVLEGFPGEYCYFAWEWDTAAEAAPIVVLEKSH
jgi:hypothetical protein